MKTYDYSIEGLNLQIDVENKTMWESRTTAYIMRSIRAQTGMSVTEFCNWLGIPTRTMQQWEKGDRVMPEYVMRLIAYKVAMEKQLGKL